MARLGSGCRYRLCRLYRQCRRSVGIKASAISSNELRGQRPLRRCGRPSSTGIPVDALPCTVRSVASARQVQGRPACGARLRGPTPVAYPPGSRSRDPVVGQLSSAALQTLESLVDPAPVRAAAEGRPGRDWESNPTLSSFLAGSAAGNDAIRKTLHQRSSHGPAERIGEASASRPFAWSGEHCSVAVNIVHEQK